MKKNIIRTVALLLCVVLASLSLAGCSTRADINMKATGVCMTVEEFRALHEGEKTLEECQTQECQMAISNLKINSDNVTMYLTQVRGKLYQMSSIMGRFFADETRTKAGQDVVVGWMLDSLNESANINSIGVLLFQICHGNEPDDTLLVNKELSGQPHLKVYTVDEDNVLYFYEVPLPDIFAGVHSADYEAVNAFDKWYEDILKTGGNVEVEG
ncbi:MAG: hypothetical protein IJY28_00750 [Clostridia bacterium]|nr:hypothetical protein [Clostridia bacterium]